MDSVSGVECQQLMGRGTDLLYDQRDRTFFDICIGDRQGHTLRMIIYADDHEMTGTTATGNKRSFNYKLRYIVRKESFGNDFIHNN